MTQNGPGSLQAAIDNAEPGDLMILEPGVYNEMVLMWKPVRLQGVGAASSVIDANTQPEGKMDPWRQKVNCLFGLALNGQPCRVPPRNSRTAIRSIRQETRVAADGRASMVASITRRSIASRWREFWGGIQR